VRTAAVAGLAVLLSIPAWGGQKSEAQKLLDLALHPPKKAFTAKKLVTVWYGKKSRAVEQRVMYRPPGWWRHEVLDPAGRQVKTVLQRAGKEWILLW